MHHPHEIEEQEYRDGPVLWDADPDVCCAAFQLGACEHTESWDPSEHEADEDEATNWDEVPWLDRPRSLADAAEQACEEPF